MAGVIDGNVAHITWTAPADREPNYYKVERINYADNGSVEEFQVTETKFDDADLPAEGIDRSYSVKAVYDECESEYALAADGQAFVRLTNLGINEADNALRIYPNPTNGQVTIETMASQVAVYNIVGQLIESKSVENGTVTFNLGQFSDGVYFIKVGNAIQKIVKI